MSVSGADEGVAVFDRLYERSPDPWGTRTLWYERRKRALLLAALPRERYDTAYEAGCGTGHLTAELAERCGTLVASDASDTALAIAARLVAALDNVALMRHRLPDEWPTRAFDLIVLGELLYFLDDGQRVAVARHARRSAGEHGLVVAVDWRGEIEGRGHSGESVHREFGDLLDLPSVFTYCDDDCLLSGWSADTTSAAQRDGLR